MCDTMENRINQIIELEDGNKYIVLKQAIYHDENYFTAARISDDEANIYEEFHLLHEVNESGETFIETVTDDNLVQLLLKYFDKE